MVPAKTGRVRSSLSSLSRRVSDLLLEKYATSLKCACGQIGTAGWEKAVLPEGSGPEPVLVEVSNGFYTRVRKKDVRKTEIVCDLCGSIVRT